MINDKNRTHLFIVISSKYAWIGFEKEEEEDDDSFVEVQEKIKYRRVDYKQKKSIEICFMDMIMSTCVQNTSRKMWTVQKVYPPIFFCFEIKI